MASKTVDVSFCTLSKVISLNPSKAMEHQSPRGASSLLKVSSSVALSDLKVTLWGVSGGRGGVQGVEKGTQRGWWSEDLSESTMLQEQGGKAEPKSIVPRKRSMRLEGFCTWCRPGRLGLGT